MSLKRLVFTAVIVSVMAPSWTFAELTKQDLKEIEALLSGSEKRIREYVDIKIAALENELKAEMRAMGAEVRADVGGVQSDVNALKWWVGSLTAFILVLIALPQVLSYFRERGEVGALRERQTMEMEELKARVAQLEERLTEGV